VSRLFLRIWLSFWSVLAVTFAAALAVDYALAVKRSQDMERLSPAALAASGAQALARGEAAGRLWLLREHNARPELGVLVIAPDGRELTGRAPAEAARALAEPHQGSPFPAEVDKTVGGRTWRFIFHRVHRLDFDAWDVLLQPWVLAGLVLSVSGLGSAWLARSLTGPIRRLQGRVRAIAEGDFADAAEPALAARRDELGALARDVDHMAARLQALIAAREAMLRDVSHELRAPLARLRASLDLAQRRGRADPAFARMDREIDRLEAMIAQILRFSRLQAAAQVAPQPLDLAELVAAAVDDARLEAAATGKTVALSSAGGLLIEADTDLARSALENVLRNALRFSRSGAGVDVRLDARGGFACVTVADRGPGVAEDRLAAIFEPFHGEGSGAGLGLAITRRVMALHGGWATAGNREGGGLAVTLGFPLARAPAPAGSLQSFALSRHT